MLNIACGLKNPPSKMAPKNVKPKGNNNGNGPHVCPVPEGGFVITLPTQTSNIGYWLVNFFQGTTVPNVDPVTLYANAMIVAGCPADPGQQQGCCNVSEAAGDYILNFGHHGLKALLVNASLCHSLVVPASVAKKFAQCSVDHMVVHGVGVPVEGCPVQIGPPSAAIPLPAPQPTCVLPGVPDGAGIQPSNGNGM